MLHADLIQAGHTKLVCVIVCVCAAGCAPVLVWTGWGGGGGGGTLMCSLYIKELWKVL